MENYKAQDVECLKQGENSMLLALFHFIFDNLQSVQIEYLSLKSIHS